MTWVRNPWWDGFWLLSGLPIGLALMWFMPNRHVGLMAVLMLVLATGHSVSPVILAWSKPGLRYILYREWGIYIALPFLLMAGCLLLPWPAVFGIYFAWNAWHFGMQIFGITCLYCRPKSHDGRFWRAFGCLLFTVFSICIFPYLGEGPKMHMLSFGVFSIGHWLSDIGLSSQASGWRWGFIPLVLVIGVVWMMLLRNGPLSVQLVPQILAIRVGIGMIHFVYSARVWKRGAAAALI